MELTIDEALKKGVEAHKLQQIQEADKFYTAILQVQPKHPDANHNMGVLAVGVGKVQEALPFFKAALEARSSIAQYWLSYIDALIKLGQIADAKAVFYQAKSKGASGETFDQLGIELSKLSTNPQDPPSDLLQPIINLYIEGQLQQALSESTQMLERFPNSVVLYNIAGVSSAGLMQFDAAIDSYKQALKIKPDYAEAYGNMGIALKEKGDLDASIDSYKQALKIKPDYAEAYSNMGIALNDKGDLDASIDSYKKALKVKPDFAEAYSNMANALKEKGDLDASIDSYKQALKIKPDYAEAYSNMGIALNDKGDLDASIDSYKQALKIKPDFAAAYNNMGIALKDKGDLDASIDSYKKALKVKPDFAEAYSNMANALKEKGDLDASIDSYKQALKIKPDYAEAYSNMGNTLEELGRLDEAETSYTQAIALEPDSENAAQNMVKLPVGQLDLKILALLDKALLVQSESVKNQASYYFFKANLLKHKGLMERSFDEFCKANKLRWEEVREQFATYDRACTGNLNRIRQWTPNAPELVESGLTKLFLVGPSKSGKSSLEHALSRSSQVKPLYEGIRYSGLSKAVVNGKDPYETLYEKHFFQSEDEFLRQGY